MKTKLDIKTTSIPMGTSTTQKSSSESWSYNNREREIHQPNLSHSSMSKSYSSSTSPRSGKVALDEQTQLDQILSDLLNDQAFVSQKSAPGTRSFKTVEEHTSPEGNVVVQRSDVTYKLPEVRSEKHYTVKTETKTVQDDKYKPVNAFTYTPSSPEMSRSFEPLRSPQSPKAPYRTDYENNYKKESYSYQSNGPSSLSDGESLSWLQQQQAKLREKSTERDPHRQRNEQMLIQELKKSQTQNKYFQKQSQSEDESSTKVSSPLQNGPTSPYSYTVSRTHTYNTEKSPTENGFRPHDTLPVAASHTTYITEQTTSSKVSNKPPPSPNLQRTVTPTLSSPPVPPPQRTSSRDYMQHQTQQQQQQQQQTRNRSYSGGAYQQSTSSWKTETHTQPRVVQRHNSESAYDREHYERQHESRQQFKTPPLSPRSVSPHTFQNYKTVYKTIHHDEPDFSQPQPVEVKIEKQTQKEQQTVQQQQEVNKPHYITEVIVQRTGGTDSKNSTLSRNDREKQDTDNRLEALEKSLQAAQNSIIASTPWQQQQQQNVIKQEVRQFETRTYETKTEQRQEQRHEQQRIQQTQSEAPKKIEVTEEDRITLKPIGPGVQQLEPEGSVHSTSTLGRDSTLGRATTPNFPTSPVASAEHIIQAVHEKARRMSIGSSNQSLNSIGGYLATPPFPVTPRTPYTNVSVATSQYHTQGYPAPRSQQSPFGFGSSTRSGGPYSSQQSLNSVFEREEADRERYNTIVSRQLMHSAHDPTYASIPDQSLGNVKVSGNVVSPTGTLQSDKMQFQNQYQQQQSYSTSTLPHQTSGPVSQPFTTNTLPHQTSFNQQHQQSQQQQYQQRSYQTYQTSSSSSSQQQYHTSQQHHHNQQFSGSNQDSGLQIDTNPRMLMTQPARSPSSPGSPPSPGNLNTLRQQLHIAHNMSNSAVSPGPHSATGQSSPSVYFGLSRRGSLTSLADTEAVHTTPRFVKDTSKFWYKPNISREEAIMMLKDKAPGTFVVRDSNSFPGAFGLALKVATLPPNVQTKSTGDPQADLVRHFLIEPTSKGVRLRGCSNEPVFGSLASLVYQHSITPLALPCKLVLPEHDPAHIVSESSSTVEMPNSASQLLAQGAACNVVYLNSVDTESLTGPQAVAKACKVTFDNPPPKTTHVHFKVSNQGITLTDNQRKLFFRRHYPVAAVTYCGGDPEDRKWKRDMDTGAQADARVFGFVARKQGSISDNCCHLFAELDPDQPASAIVNFVTKVMIGQGKIKS
ncbi:Tensin-3 [Mactra antiquata]